MDSRDIQETIRAYLDGNMTVQEKTDFDKAIKNSKELAEEVRQFRQMRIFLKNKDLIEAKTLLASIMVDIPIEPDYGTYEQHFKKSVFENPLWRWFMGGLAVALLISGVFFYQKNQAKQTLINLSKRHLEPMSNILGLFPNDQTPVAKAMRAYDNKNYTETIPLLNDAIKDHPDDNSLRLYLAISYLMLEQHIKAETVFQELIKANDLTTIPAQWYLALSLLQSGQKDEARILLQTLESDPTFGNRTKMILKDL